MAFFPFLAVSQPVVKVAEVIGAAGEGGPALFTVTVDGQPFTTVRLGPGGRRPILYPVFGPGQVPMVRNHPMVKGVKGEATDHSHHQSIWFAHGALNGVDFWHQKPGSGRVRVLASTRLDNEGGPEVLLECRGESAAGEPVMNQDMRFAFGADATSRWIDVDVALSPLGPSERLVFDETKEGLMGIRTHPGLRVENDPRRGVTEATGELVNSNGVVGRDAWGKPATWLAVTGRVEGRPAGLAFLAHPDNFRNPARWHVRHYGLLAANPFGGHDFDPTLPKGSGRLELPAGESLRLRYRLVFYDPSITSRDANTFFFEWVGRISE